MHGLNSLSTYGTHPKDFDPEQVKPALSNQAIIMKWYLRYKGVEIHIEPSAVEEQAITGSGKQKKGITILEKSIAVLPFINDSPDQENTYFINGVMEEILNSLQKIKDLRVISRTSVEKFRGQQKAISEIAQELDVNYIVEGSGQKYGKTFRLRTQLIKAERETHLWAEAFQQEINNVIDIFSIQIQIAKTIAEKLEAIITPQEKKYIEKVPTKNLDAYDTYLKGMFYWKKLEETSLDTALEYFEQAIEKDPNYAPAYAGISFVWGAKMQFGYLSPNQAIPKVMEALAKALEKDCTNAEVQYAQAGIATWIMWDWDSGEAAFKRTLEMNPNHSEANAYYAHLLSIRGRPEDALKHGRQSLKLDPINPLLNMLYGVVLLIARKYDEAIIIYSEALKQNTSNVGALWGLTYAFHLTGRFDEALENWMKAARLLHNKEIEASIFKSVDSIYFRHMGYETLVFTYQQIESMKFKVELSEENISLDEIIVSANRWEDNKIENPYRIEKISLEEVSFQNPQTSADMIGANDYIYIQKSQLAGGSPTLRGFAANRVMIVVDGVRMNNAIFRTGNLKNIISIDASSLESTEILFGPGAVMYGSDAIGGVMSFHTLEAKLSDGEKPLIKGSAFGRFSSGSIEKSGHFDLNLGF
jgi:TolB-like protein/Tfp pilus assembly protein PilF